MNYIFKEHMEWYLEGFPDNRNDPQSYISRYLMLQQAESNVSWAKAQQHKNSLLSATIKTQKQ